MGSSGTSTIIFDNSVHQLRQDLTRENQIRKYHLEALLKVLNDAHVELIRFLRAQFGALYSDWEVSVFPSSAFSDPPPGNRNHNLPFEIKKRFDEIPAEMSPFHYEDGVKFMTNAVNHLRLDLEDLLEITTKDLKKELGDNFDALGGNLHVLTKFKALDAKLYELPVLVTKAKIGRYREECQKLFHKAADLKTIEEVLKQDGEEKENLILEMIKVEREKMESIEKGSGNSQEAGVVRKKMEDRLNGAEPWKEARAQNNKLTGDFLKWERENGYYGRPGALEEFMRLEAAKKTR